MARARLTLLLCLFACVVAGARPSLAAPRPAAPVDPNAAEARAAFLEGTGLVEKAQWAEALASFERASKLRPHPVTTYNIGACERAMGRYTRARDRFRAALAENETGGGHLLPESLLTETKGDLGQIDEILAKVAFTIRPDNAAIQVDGRPLGLPEGEAGTPTVVAGLREPGPGEPPPAGTFTLVIDPGAHVFSFARKGFSEQIVNKTFEPGKTYNVTLELDRLPATLHIASNREGSIVVVNGSDVGPAPIDLLRPAGDYKVAVQKQGFAKYETQVSLKAGEETDLRAALPEEKKSLVTRWWFWTAAAVVVAGAAVGTYYLTRPAPERESVSGGSLGWKVSVP
jgi:tetratricopeptide (TPR) repeat protein